MSHTFLEASFVLKGQCPSPSRCFTFPSPLHQTAIPYSWVNGGKFTMPYQIGEHLGLDISALTTQLSASPQYS